MSKRHRCLGLLGAVAMAALSAGVSRAAVVFSDDFESGTDTTAPTNWTATNAAGDGIYKKPSPGLVGGNLPDGNPSVKSFVQDDAQISRISRAFTANAAATSFKLSWYQYINTTSTSTQRSIGQLSTGTVASPGAGTTNFFRWGTVNTTTWGYIYSNGATTTVNSPTPINTGSPGWHKMQMTVTPGAAGSDSVVFQVDANTPITLSPTTTIPVPNLVTLGNNVANGVTTDTFDSAEYFDSVLLEQFAPAAVQVSGPSPSDLSTAVDPNQDLSWTGGANTSGYNVYLDTNPSPTTLVGSTASTTFDPGTLADNTTYFWRVDAKNAVGDATTGQVYSFTTGSVPEPASMGLIALSGLGLLRRRRSHR